MSGQKTTLPANMQDSLELEQELLKVKEEI